MHVKEHYDSDTVQRSTRRKRRKDFKEKKLKIKHQKQPYMDNTIAVKLEEEEDGRNDELLFDSENDKLSGNKSLWSKRNRQKIPLSIYERTHVNPDQYLCESQESQHKLSGFPQLKQELDLQHHLIRQIPNVIENLQTSIMWDIILLKTESTKFTFGIPGECVCFICNSTLRTVPEKHMHQVLLHGGGTQSESYKCDLCLKHWSLEDAAFNHAKSEHLALFIPEESNEQRQPIIKTSDNNTHPPYYQCKYCSIVATTEIAFWTHTFLRHKRYKERMQCEICSQLCSNATQYRRHILVEHGEYKYRCFECSKTFRPVDSFRLHIKDHEVQVNTKSIHKYK